MLAAQHPDTAALWSLTEARTLLYGHAGASLSPRTARSYREGVTRFVRHAGHAGVSVIRPERDAGPVYARTLEGQGLAPSSVRVYLAAARALYKALRWAEVTALDPFSDTTAAKDKTAAWDKRQPYLEEEVQALLAASSLRDRALILLCAHGGLRIMEALALTCADLQGDALVVRQGKGGKGRRVTCSGTLLAALGAWCEVDGTPDGRIIGAGQTAARERLRGLCKRAGRTGGGTLSDTTPEPGWPPTPLWKTLPATWATPPSRRRASTPNGRTVASRTSWPGGGTERRKGRWPVLGMVSGRTEALRSWVSSSVIKLAPKHRMYAPIRTSARTCRGRLHADLFLFHASALSAQPPIDQPVSPPTQSS